MGPIATEARDKYDDDASVKFVTFDFTSDETTAASAAKAEALGMAELYAANAPKTGFALVVNAESKEVIGTFSAKNAAPEWNAAIDGALEGM